MRWTPVAAAVVVLATVPGVALGASGWSAPERLGASSTYGRAFAEVGVDGVARVVWGGVGPNGAEGMGVWVAEEAGEDWTSRKVFATASPPFVALSRDLLAWNVGPPDPASAGTLSLSQLVAGMWTSARVVARTEEFFGEPSVSAGPGGVIVAGRRLAVAVDAAAPFSNIREFVPDGATYFPADVFALTTPVAVMRRGWGPIFMTARQPDGEWTPTLVSPPGQSHGKAHGPAAVRDGDGVLLAWTYQNDFSTWVARIDPRGVVGRPQRLPADRAVARPAVAANASGQAAIAFADQIVLRGPRFIRRIKVAQRAGSGTWSVPRVIPDARGVPIAVAVRENGRMIVAFVESRFGLRGPPSPVRVARQDSSGRWQVSGPLTGRTSRPVFAQTPDGDAILMWTEDETSVFARVYRTP